MNAGAGMMPPTTGTQCPPCFALAFSLADFLVSSSIQDKLARLSLKAILISVIISSA